MTERDRFPTPAYSPLGWAILAIGLWYGVIIRVGAVLYALVGRKW